LGPEAEGRPVDNPPTRSEERGVEFTAVTDAGSRMTPEQASRLTVIAVAADLEYWPGPPPSTATSA
jgi:hypothetical protein